MKKVFIVRNFDASYFNKLTSTLDEEEFEKRLNEDYGKHGYTICATIPIIDGKEKVIAYKFIFVKDCEEEDEEQ